MLFRSADSLVLTEKSIEVINAASVNTYSILNADSLVLTEKSIEVINDILNKKEA